MATLPIPRPGDTPERYALRGIRDVLAGAFTDTPGPNRLRLPSGEVVTGEVADAVHELFTGIRALADDALRLGGRE